MAELGICVTIDRTMGFTIDLSAKKGSTIRDLKQQLADSDPTGGTKVVEFGLGLPSKSPGQQVVPLPDSTPLTEEHKSLDLCQNAVAPPVPEPASQAVVPPVQEPVSKMSEQDAIGKVDGHRKIWEVVGGADKGGIMVRDGADLKSPPASDRLATGSTVEELEIRGERLNYKLVTGAGPEEGWVSIRLGAKDLLVPEGSGQKAPEPEDTWKPPSTRDGSELSIRAAVGKPWKVLGLEPGASSGSVRRAYHSLCLLHHPDKGGDAAIFKMVGDAYKALTEARDQETGGWRDLEGQAVGPWHAHAASTKGVTCMLFDCFGAPPWESRRLYTGSWQEASVRCWELSKGEPGKVRPPPRLVGEIQVGGFVNDIAAISPFGMITAQSAGMKPLPGESLRVWNLKSTPFKQQKKTPFNSIKDRDGTGAITNGTAGSQAIVEARNALAQVDEEDDSQDNPDTSEQRIPDAGNLDEMSQMVYLHQRGCRSISLWPRPESRESTPVVAGTCSKDTIAVSKIDLEGFSVESPAVWSFGNPHNITDVNVVRHESANRMWSGDNRGIVKLWDVSGAPETGDILTIGSNSGWITGMEVWAEPGVLVASHSNGICFIDTKAGKTIRQQTTKAAVGKLCILNGDSPIMFAGIGEELLQYDTRMYKDGKDAKPKAIGQWTLDANITSMHCTETRKGHLLIGVGCLNGKVAAFDAS